VLDMDGTIYRGAHLFECTLPFLDRLASLRIGRTFVTNNTSRSKADYVAKLRGLGISVDEESIFTPADSTIAYLRKRHAGVDRIGVLGTASLVAQMEQAGFEVSWDDPQAVVVGFDTTLDYERLCRAAYWIAQGVPFIATHPDLICPTDEPTVLVDCGAICECLKAATGREPVVLGKPDPSILLSIAERRGLHPGEIAMVGDRLYTDIAMARSAGALPILVLTGEATAADAQALPPGPLLVLQDVGELGNLLAQSHTAGVHI
jgi:HAD superfamily hydrolase (TIGR01450 family)